MRHFAVVHRVIAGRVHHDHVDDVLQRTFLAAVERRDQVFEDSGFRPYVLGIARIQLLRYYRDQQRNDRTTDIDSGVPAVNPTPSSMLGRHEQVEQLWAALRTLSIDFQLALQLYYWEDLSTREVAQVLDVAPGTVRSRLARARAALWDALSATTPAQQLPARESLGEWTRSFRELR